MQYRSLGQTDIRVSLIALGTMTFGEQNTQAEAFEQMDCARSEGVNIIDVAEIYPVPPRQQTYGDAERIVGRWMSARGCRDNIVLATKVTGNGSHNPGFDYIRGGPRLSATHIKQAVEGSLKRLQTDYIDLYQLHLPDRATNFFGRLGYEHTAATDAIGLHESLSALSDLVAEGKIRAIGLSNEIPWGVMESCRIAAMYDLPRVVSIQNPYNLLNRSYEVGLAEISMRERIGLLAYSPLAFGVLSGKYLEGQSPPMARLTLYDRFKRYVNPYAYGATVAYVELARSHGLDPVDMALAFVNKQPFVTTNIVGATTVAQLQQNIASVNKTLSTEVQEGIELIHLQYSNPTP